MLSTTQHFSDRSKKPPTAVSAHSAEEEPIPIRGELILRRLRGLERWGRRHPPMMQRTMRNATRWVTATMLAATATTAPASSFLLPDDDTHVVGRMQSVTARDEETLLDIAHRHNLGYEEIRLANPGIDPWLPGQGTRVVLPTRFVLPDAPRHGIVLNLAEMRLYYFPRPRRGEPATVLTHPVSIGRRDWQTPIGRTTIAAKAKDPTWYPPESIRAEHAANGDPLPEIVPPGPDNPLGRHALRLGLSSYLIHGTNKPFGIGMRVSHGCIRMYPHDIAALFDRIPVGTPVHIVNQAIKAGWAGDVLYVEVHPAFSDELGKPWANPTDSVRRVVAVTPSARMKRVNWKRLDAAIEEPRGTAIAVSSPTANAVGVSLKLDRTVTPRAQAESDTTEQTLR